MLEPNNINLLLRLLIAHFLADFLFQTKTSINDRRKNTWSSKYLYFHATVYSSVLFIFSLSWTNWLWIIPAFLISHVLIDGIKSSLKDSLMYFLADQLIHIFIIFLIWLAISPITLGELLQQLQPIFLSHKILLVALGYVLILWPSAHLLNCVLMSFQRNSIDLQAQEEQGLINAGFLIGCLERVLAYSFVLIGYWSAVGFLITAKSIFRFGEIKDPAQRKVAEYILIGTLCSFTIAIGLGYIVRLLMTLII